MGSQVHLEDFAGERRAHDLGRPAELGRRIELPEAQFLRFGFQRLPVFGLEVGSLDALHLDRDQLTVDKFADGVPRTGGRLRATLNPCATNPRGMRRRAQSTEPNARMSMDIKMVTLACNNVALLATTTCDNSRAAITLGQKRDWDVP